MELIFQEGSYLIKTLSTHEEMEAAYRLRHEVFVDELKWVPACPFYSGAPPIHDRKRICMPFTERQTFQKTSRYGGGYKNMR
ncbi:MAG: hypothetical protein HZB79_01240 [Deltaproteobacteria bacterium]|nr:hypothetical protein [Deltaproteobacteria bacterium]